MAHEEFQDALPLYAAGALERSERQSVDAHLLTGCTSCHAALREYQAAAAVLPRGLTPVRPPAALKDRIMAAATQPVAAAQPAKRATAEEPPAWIRHIQPPRNFRVVHPALAAGLVLVLVAVAGYAWHLQSQIGQLVAQRDRAESDLKQALARAATLQREAESGNRQLVALQERSHAVEDAVQQLREREEELQRLRTTIAENDIELAGLRRAVAQRDELMPFFRSAHVKVVPLAGMDRAKSAGAFMLCDPETHKAFFYGYNLPPLPPGKTYQLWAILDRPVSAGTFATDPGLKGRMMVRQLPELGAIKKFAVSIEPEGGRPQPTGDIYLAGQL